jgi:hypothetical protein
MNYTLSFSEAAKGWTSFFSFIPEKMIGMNTYFYTFKGGNLFRHNANETRNNFYGSQHNSTITGVLNVAPNVVKTFKTVSLRGNDPWKCDIVTDMSTGVIDSSYFKEKEGFWFSYIRRYSQDNDLALRSAQGIGSPSSVVSTNPSNVIVNFSFKIGSIVSVGDIAYVNNNGAIKLLGPILSLGDQHINIDSTVIGGSIPTTSNFVLYIKNSVAESYAPLGYYMQFKLENDNTSRSELYSVESSIFKSFP